ncbi:hypothetical protein EBZ39_19620 [bacterium]|nr:hypothetical protein [bacterium]
MSTEISTHTAPARGLALATFDDAFRFAKVVAATEFAPKDFRGKPEACLLAIQHGAELGLSPMQSLQSIAVVNGRPSVYGDTALAVCKGSPVCEWVRERIEGDGDAMVAICEAKRRGDAEPVVSRFTMADAKRAGLAGKSGPWTQYPRRMLQMRARGFALRDAFPDLLHGLITAEEAQDYPTPTTPREPVQVRPKFDATPPDAEPEVPDAPARATSEDMAKARHAVQGAKTDQKLREIRGKVEKRFLDEGFYSDAQADELFALIDTKREIVSGQEVAS